MRKFGFISQHKITAEQQAMANAQDIELVQLADADAFEGEPSEFFDGFVVVHPAMAIRLLARGYAVGIFENAKRGEGGFYPKAFHLFTMLVKKGMHGQSLSFWHGPKNIGSYAF